jgi:hypothetical protein
VTVSRVLGVDSGGSGLIPASALATGSLRLPRHPTLPHVPTEQGG